MIYYCTNKRTEEIKIKSTMKSKLSSLQTANQSGKKQAQGE